MKKLHSNKNIISSDALTTKASVLILKLTEQQNIPGVLRPKLGLIIDKISYPLPIGFGIIFSKNLEDSSIDGVEYLSPDLDHLASGDIIRVSPSRNSVRALYRVSSNANFLFVTERCNSFCLMCSQPPKDVDDSHLVEELIEAVPLIDDGATEIGITGGEPTLLGDRLFALIKALKVNLPGTSVHILTNGRNFNDVELSRKLLTIDHSDLMLGIPLYSDLPHVHDYVVQADGAFDETITGILNLKQHRQKVELRVVIHKITYERLPMLAEYIVRNLQFVDHVALMGLEITGFTRANLDELWVDPVDYMESLEEAVNILSKGNVKTSIYNLQRCLLPRYLWKYSVKSISDWKNKYYEECKECLQKAECGGFFASSDIKRSEHIRAIEN